MLSHTGSVTRRAPFLAASVTNLTALAMLSLLDAPTASWTMASLNSIRKKNDWVSFNNMHDDVIHGGDE